MNKLFSLLSLLILTSLLFSSCKEDPMIPEEPEIITTLNMSLSPADGSEDVILSFVDIDGDGGNDPVITGGVLAVNQSYTGTLQLLNQSVTPSESITEEIAEEDEEHQFFFQSNITDLSIDYNDQDADGNPIGLSINLTTGEAGSGTLTVILRHEPNKSGSGVSAGDITNAGGETDIEVTFPIDVL